MESTHELQHWGIKGQRWGIRRYQNPDGTLTEAGKKRYYYQNPDGSLTEAGKKDYMKAAKNGKLDVSKLSDNDLNMINSRFAREKTYKQNVKEYRDSIPSVKLKKAMIESIKGIKGGKGKGKGGGNGLGKILALPIKKAFEEAFKDQKFDDKDDSNKSSEEKEAIKLTRNGYRFMQSGYREDKEGRDAREANGRRFMDNAFNSRESRTAEDILRGRHKHDRTRATATEANGPRNSRGLPSGGIYMDPSEYSIHSAITIIRSNSSDELYHWGIKGQKWGVRRFENADGTLTPEGRERYGSGNGRSYIGGANRAKRETAMIDKETDPKKKSDAMQKMLDDLYEDREERYEKYSKGEEIEKSDKTEYLDEASSWLMDKIIKESGDWYWNEPVSDANKKISKNIDDLKDNIEKEYVKSTGKNWYGGFISDKERKKYPALSEMVDKMQQLQNDRLGVVLTDIGMKDTPDNRTKIRDYVYWD